MPSAWTPQTSQLKAANIQNADGTTSVLVKAIQEQQAIIEDLKTRLADLEAKP
jgi:hypothetical protein